MGLRKGGVAPLALEDLIPLADLHNRLWAQPKEIDPDDHSSDCEIWADPGLAGTGLTCTCGVAAS